MGFKETWNRIIKGETGQKDKRDQLADVGLTVLQDTKLAERQQALQALFEELNTEITTTEPIAYVEKLNERLDLVNRAIHSLASPYYRSGSNPPFRQLMEGWTLWYALAKTWISAVQDRIRNVTVHDAASNQVNDLAKITAIDIETLVRRLHHVLEMHVFQDGMLVLAESYLSEDVAPANATVVQTVGQHGGFDMKDLKREDVT